MTDLPTSCDRSYKKAKSKIVPKLMMEFFFISFWLKLKIGDVEFWGEGWWRGERQARQDISRG